MEVRSLRAELELLRADRIDKGMHQAPADRYQESQDRFRTVFDNSPFGQQIITSDLVIRQVNGAVLEMLEYDRPEDVVGHQMLEFVHPDHRDDWRFWQERLWAHELPSFTLETCLVRADGSPLWCQVTSIRFLDGDEELGHTQLEDISERKTMELSLKRLYDAQETMLHLVIHDLKAPIGHIQLLTDLLERQLNAAVPLAAGSAPAAVKYLGLIRQACATTFKLLQDVLLLGALDANRLKKEPTDLGTLLERRLAAHHLVAHEKGLALALDLPPLAVRANLNADAFGRVVDNLVSNALKFTPAGGRVTVALRERAGRALLSVRDTGIGIPAALHAGLFEKFSVTARPGVGGEDATGLGLFITRQIVQLHRGKVWVESQEGAGTCFFVELA